MSATPPGLVESFPHDLWIGGRWQPAQDDRRFAVINPATGAELAQVADASAADGVAALQAAAAAQSTWAATAPNERSELLYNVFLQLRARSEELAALLTLEMGKSVAEARGEIAYAAEFFRWFSGEALRLDGYYKTAGAGGSRVMVTREAVGPCLFITPWNFPAAMGARKIAPAIAAGCTMVIKPAAQTPLSMLALARILEEAGLPAGVLNLITTSTAGEVTEPLLADPRLAKLSFTGSTSVGRHLMRQASQQLLRVSMELGGNAPLIVFADADLDKAVAGTMVAKMRNIGQACTAANRILVHVDVVEEFTSRLITKMQALQVGPGMDPDNDVGPLISATERDKVAQLVNDALAKGATCLLGGHSIDGPGYFYAPTVLTDVPPQARVLQEEIFGPVAPIMTFTTEAEAVDAANNTEYGLVAYVFTQDLDRARRVSEQLAVGMVGVNQGMVSDAGAPFGGVKHSGFGREGGNEGIMEFLETKYVAYQA